jgi:hypothetical protein
MASTKEHVFFSFIGAVVAGLVTTFIYGWYQEKRGNTSTAAVKPVSTTPSKWGKKTQTNPQGAGGLGSQPAGNPAQAANYLSGTSPKEIEAALYVTSTSRASTKKVAAGASGSSQLLSGGPQQC